MEAGLRARDATLTTYTSSQRHWTIASAVLGGGPISSGPGSPAAADGQIFRAAESFTRVDETRHSPRNRLEHAVYCDMWSQFRGGVYLVVNVLGND